MDHEEEEQLCVLSDDPSISSAALSTTIHLLDHTFRPEFTHQCLPFELYRGHRPEESKVTSHPLYKQGKLLHQSHRFHDLALYTLNVEIQLAPSCSRCRVLLHRKRHDTLDQQEPITKKPRQEMEPMTEEEIKASISKALPNIVDEEDDCTNEFCDEPIGTIIAEYSRGGQDFVVTIADGATAANYHSQVQKLALWFIENADDVNVGDDQSGFWYVVYLFVKNADKKYSLGGYLSLFHFHVPFHKPIPGVLARVCQALILPPYQGQGHGTKLMECVYELAQGKHACYPHPIVQVNVEDPSPKFAFLRNIVDYQYLTRRENRPWWPKLLSNANPAAADVDNDNSDDTFLFLLEDKDAFLPLSEAEVSMLSTKAKITPRQVLLVHEFLHLQALLASTSKSPDLETRFRLMVKKRLNREHKEDMTLYPSKEEKKAFLSRLYDEHINPYKTWMEKQRKVHRSDHQEEKNSIPSL